MGLDWAAAEFGFAQSNCRPAAKLAEGLDQNPSIAFCRDHSIGGSVKRVNPIPRGSLPSMAALTRSGAMNASEIIMATRRGLHRSRAAMTSGPETIP